MTGNLAPFGYTEREATFLMRAGLQSGYFLRRQFNTFIGRECGALAQRFIDRASRLGHVRMLTGWGHRVLYHVCGNAFYAQLGEAGNRNRREHRPDTVRHRLMILDYMISGPEQGWLLTEQSRRDYFSKLGVTEVSAPGAAIEQPSGSFADRQPISVASNGTPEFAFVDASLRGFSEWERFLKRQRSLFSQIDGAEIVYASCDSERFQLAENLFRRIVAGEAADGGIDVERLRGYFSTRRLFEERRYGSFDQPRLNRLREDKRVYAGEAFETLYSRWLQQGDRALAGLKVSRVRFRTQVLSHGYEWLSPIRIQERRAAHAPHPSTDEESSRDGNGQARQGCRRPT